MTVETSLVCERAALADLAADWERLAAECAQPLSAPAWMLAWLDHLAPAGTSPRVVVVREAGRIIGIAPFFVEPGRGGRVNYRLLGGAFPRVSPLARRGREWDVAGAMAAALARAEPRADAVALEGLSIGSPWPAALRESWPGPVRPPSREYFVQGSPTVSLEGGSFDSWLASLPSGTRRSLRRRRRAFEKAGGGSRASTAATLAADVNAFLRLHALRWETRGASSIVAVGEAMGPMLLQVGETALATGGLRLHLAEVNGEPVAAQLTAAIAGEVLLINSGWDPRFAAHAPATLVVIDAIADAFARGDRRVDFGPGEQPNKLALADGSDPVAWTLMLAPTRRLALTCARTTPMLAGRSVRDNLGRALTAQQRDRLRALLRGGRR